MNKYAKRVDANQREIVDAFKKMGASVFDASHIGAGFPDLLIGYGGRTVLVEIKSSEKAKFTDAQLKFMAEWKGSAVSRINDVQGAITLIKFLQTHPDKEESCP